MRIHLTPNDGVPIYLQIIHQVKYLVASGRLSAGDELPPIRTLAEQLLVNPNTVARAYRELEAAGVVVTRRARARTFPTPDPRWPGANASTFWPGGSTPCWPRPGK